MAKHCWIVAICVMYACAVHGDEDENRWNTICIPWIYADIGEADRVIVPAAVSDVYCAYCQRIGDLTCIRIWCNKGFRLAIAASAQRPFEVTELEQYYGWPFYPMPWPYVNMCLWYPHNDDSD
nr:Hic12 protein [Sinohyriopsis cumingii]